MLDFLSTGQVVVGVTIVTTLVLMYKYLTKNYGYWESQGIPYEKGYPIIGSEFPIFRRPMHDVDLERVRKHGRIYGSYFLSGIVFNVIDPEIIKLILVKDFHIFVNRQTKRSGLKFLDLGLVFALDDDWKRVRSIVSPTFSSGKLKKMTFMIKNIAKTLTENVMEIAERGEPVNMKKEFSKFSIEVIASTAFGIKFDPFKNPNHPFIKNSEKIFENGIRSLISFLFMLLLPNIMNGVKNKIMGLNGFGFFYEAGKEIIEKRRNQTTQKNLDFLQLMIDAKEEKTENSESITKKEINDNKNPVENLEKKAWSKTLEEDEIIAQCGTFLFAGHDSVATSISYVAYNLAGHSDVQETVLREIDDAWEKYGDIDYDIVKNLTYLNAVVSESLRLQTLGVRVNRQAKEDYQIPNTKIVIPKNGVINIPVYALHHDPEFFPEPEKFDPERFFPENKDKIKPYTYMPFSDGPRNCVAMRFALMEVKFCLAYVLRYIKFVPPEIPMKPLEFFVGAGVLQSKGVVVKLEKRRELDTS